MISVVSTFSIHHAPIYGNTFLAECAAHGVPLTLVHFENFDGIACHGELRLDATRGGAHEDVDLWRFREYCASRVQHSRNYRYQAARFGWKVFAKTRKDIQCCDWLVWLDADTRIKGKPDWSKLLNDDADVCYLGRRHWDHSECGFVAYNMNRRGPELLANLRNMYVSGQFLTEREYHDSWLFDRVRERGGFIGHDLSPNAEGLDAWEASPLIEWSDHLKGNRKFMRVVA